MSMSMSAPTFIDVDIEPNPNVPAGCALRFQALGPVHGISAVRYWLDPDTPAVCDVSGWWSAGGVGMSCPAHVVPIEAPGVGPRMLVYGGDWGLRLTPRLGGGDPFGEPCLLLAPEDILE